MPVDLEQAASIFKHALEVPSHTRNHLVTSYSLPRGLVSARKPREPTVSSTMDTLPLPKVPLETPRPKGFQGYMLLNSEKFKKFVVSKDRARQQLSQRSPPSSKKIEEPPKEQPSLSRIYS